MSIGIDYKRKKVTLIEVKQNYIVKLILKKVYVKNLENSDIER